MNNSMEDIAALLRAGLTVDQIVALGGDRARREKLYGAGSNETLFPELRGGSEGDLVRLGGGYGYLPGDATRAGIAANYRLGRAQLAQTAGQDQFTRGEALSNRASNPFNVVGALDAYARSGNGQPVQNAVLDNIKVEGPKYDPAYDQFIKDFLSNPESDPGDTARVRSAYDRDSAAADTFFRQKPEDLERMFGRGHAAGGYTTLREPMVGIGANSGRVLMTAAENGPEDMGVFGNRLRFRPRRGVSKRLDPRRQQRIIGQVRQPSPGGTPVGPGFVREPMVPRAPTPIYGGTPTGPGFVMEPDRLRDPMVPSVLPYMTPEDIGEHYAQYAGHPAYDATYDLNSDGKVNSIDQLLAIKQRRMFGVRRGEGAGGAVPGHAAGGGLKIGGGGAAVRKLLDPKGIHAANAATRAAFKNRKRGGNDPGEAGFKNWRHVTGADGRISYISDAGDYHGSGDRAAAEQKNREIVARQGGTFGTSAGGGSGSSAGSGSQTAQEAGARLFGSGAQNVQSLTLRGAKDSWNAGKVAGLGALSAHDYRLFDPMRRKALLGLMMTSGLFSDPSEIEAMIYDSRPASIWG